MQTLLPSLAMYRLHQVCKREQTWVSPTCGKFNLHTSVALGLNLRYTRPSYMCRLKNVKRKNPEKVENVLTDEQTYPPILQQFHLIQAHINNLLTLYTREKFSVHVETGMWQKDGKPFFSVHRQDTLKSDALSHKLKQNSRGDTWSIRSIFQLTLHILWFQSHWLYLSKSHSFLNTRYILSALWKRKVRLCG